MCAVFILQTTMQQTKKKSNILYSIIGREIGIRHGSQHLPCDKTLQQYAEEAAALPNKNLVS
jgi:hypothetical protein